MGDRIEVPNQELDHVYEPRGSNAVFNPAGEEPCTAPPGCACPRERRNQDSPADKKQDSKKNKKNDDKAPGQIAANLKKLQKELDTPYKKWLQEEVPYIITDEERSAFLRLQTNEEREQFIEAFWQRRRSYSRHGGERIQGRALSPDRLRQPRKVRLWNCRLEDRSWPYLYHLGSPPTKLMPTRPGAFMTGP